jgi:hypothetical protein
VNPFTRSHPNDVANAILSLPAGEYSLTELVDHLRTTQPTAMEHYLNPRESVGSIARHLGRKGLLELVATVPSKLSYRIFPPQADPEPLLSMVQPETVPVTLESINAKVDRILDILADITARKVG